MSNPFKAEDLPAGEQALRESLRRQLQRIEEHLSYIDPNVAEPWATVFIPGNNMVAAGGSPAYSTLGALSVLAYHLDEASTERLGFSQIMPRDYAEGTVVYPEIHWVNPGANSGGVVWEFAYAWANVSLSALSVSTLTLTSTALGALIPQRGEFQALQKPESLIQSVLIGVVSRLGGSTGDTLSDDAALVGVGLTYQRDSHGSGERQAKRF